MPPTPYYIRKAGLLAGIHLSWPSCRYACNLEVDGVVRERMVLTMGYATPDQIVKLSAHDPNLQCLTKPPVIFL